jgi:hypothetical protein
MRPSVFLPRKLDQFKDVADTFLNVLTGNPLHLRAERNVVTDPKVRKEGIGLKHKIDRPLVRRHTGH